MERIRPGDRAVAVESYGKWLSIEMASRRVLRVHLEMTGEWRVIERGQRWPKPRHLARVVLATADHEVMCFQAPKVEIGRVGDGRLDYLGPNLCSASPDLDAVRQRIADLADPTAQIGDVLLDQRLAAGIGNVYRCESLNEIGVHPESALGELDPDQVAGAYAFAAVALWDNRLRPKREVYRGGFAVYGRTGRDCRRCGGTIRVADLGTHARTTWWCERCQP
jgi:endonuclease-8